MKVAIASDHAGFALKTKVVALLKKHGCEVIDLGCHDDAAVDYPDFAQAVAGQIVQKKVERGVLICGTGIGMAIAANKFPGVRASVVCDPLSGELTRKHNDLNVLCLGARIVADQHVAAIVDRFIRTPFEGGRHAQRLDKINALEKLNMKEV